MVHPSAPRLHPSPTPAASIRVDASAAAGHAAARARPAAAASACRLPAAASRLSVISAATAAAAATAAVVCSGASNPGDALRAVWYCPSGVLSTHRAGEAKPWAYSRECRLSGAGVVAD